VVPGRTANMDMRPWGGMTRGSHRRVDRQLPANSPVHAWAVGQVAFPWDEVQPLVHATHAPADVLPATEYSPLAHMVQGTMPVGDHRPGGHVWAQHGMAVVARKKTVTTNVSCRGRQRSNGRSQEAGARWSEPRVPLRLNERVADGTTGTRGGGSGPRAHGTDTPCRRHIFFVGLVYAGMVPLAIPGYPTTHKKWRLHRWRCATMLHAPIPPPPPHAAAVRLTCCPYFFDVKLALCHRGALSSSGPLWTPQMPWRRWGIWGIPSGPSPLTTALSRLPRLLALHAVGSGSCWERLSLYVRWLEAAYRVLA
jgi:hypothetical protein